MLSPQEAGDVYQSSLLFIQAVQARPLQWPTTRSYKAIVHGLVEDIVVLYYLLQQTAKALSINARNAPSSFFLGLRGSLHLQKRRALTFRFQDIESTPRTVISSSRLSSCASSMRLGLPYIYLRLMLFSELWMSIVSKFWWVVSFRFVSRFRSSGSLITD